jgi:hypothetical protein
MKKKTGLIFTLLFMNIILSTFDISSAYILYEPNPGLITDKNNYQIDDELHINVSWSIYSPLDENLNIKLLFLDRNPYNYSIQWLNENCLHEISFPVSNGQNFYQNLINSSILFQNSSMTTNEIWIDLIFYVKNSEIYSDYYWVWKKIVVEKHSPVFKNNVSQNIATEYGENFVLNNSFRSFDNHEKLYNNPSFNISIFVQNQLKYCEHYNFTGTSEFQVEISNSLFNQTGDYVLILELYENFLFKPENFSFYLSILDKQADISTDNSSIINFDSNSNQFILYIKILDRNNELIVFNNTNWIIDSSLEIEKFLINNQKYMFFLKYPSNNQTFYLFLNISRKNYNFSSFTMNFTFGRNALDLNLSNFDLKFSNCIKFNLAINTSSLSLNNNFESIKFNLLINNTWKSINFTLTSISNSKYLIEISMDTILHLTQFMNNKTLYFKFNFKGNWNFLPNCSNIANYSYFTEKNINISVFNYFLNNSMLFQFSASNNINFLTLSNISIYCYIGNFSYFFHNLNYSQYYMNNSLIVYSLDLNQISRMNFSISELCITCFYYNASNNLMSYSNELNLKFPSDFSNDLQISTTINEKLQYLQIYLKSSQFNHQKLTYFTNISVKYYQSSVWYTIKYQNLKIFEKNISCIIFFSEFSVNPLLNRSNDIVVKIIFFDNQLNYINVISTIINIKSQNQNPDGNSEKIFAINYILVPICGLVCISVFKLLKRRVKIPIKKISFGSIKI